MSCQHGALDEVPRGPSNADHLVSTELQIKRLTCGRLIRPSLRQTRDMPPTPERTHRSDETAVSSSTTGQNIIDRREAGSKRRDIFSIAIDNINNICLVSMLFDMRSLCVLCQQKYVKSYCHCFPSLRSRIGITN